MTGTAGTPFNARFRVEKRIGLGSLATVHRATDLVAGGSVALKILSRAALAKSHEAERHLRRFKREADILRLLQGSPHVVGFVNHGCSPDGDWYIAMELLVGRRLLDVMAETDLLPLSAFRHFARHLVQGLKEIHAHDILHRDLTPDNVIVVGDGAEPGIPKFLDFSLGKGPQLAAVTQGHAILGKPQYFSPEQARGDELTPASDVYCLGVMLYEMLTGSLPLQVKGFPDLGRIQTQPPTPLERHASGRRVSADLRNVIMRCLEKIPEERPFPEEILDALETPDPEQTPGATPDSATAQAAAGPAVAGDRVGPWTLTRSEGKAPFGSIFAATGAVADDQVVVRMGDGLNLQADREEFARLAAQVRRFRAAGVVPLIDTGWVDQVPFAVTRCPEGRAVAELLKRDGPFDAEEVRVRGAALCEILAAAHARRPPLLHRDLHAGNVYVTESDTTLDGFGLTTASRALSVLGGSETSIRSVPAESVATMSPEEVEEGSRDEHSDLYALGCLLYEMLTGTPPFSGNPLAVLYQHVTQGPEPPSRRAEGVPDDLEETILALLAKEPEKRPESARRVFEMLTAPRTPARSRRRWWRR